MGRLRIGIVGCGEAAQLMHLPSLAALSGQFSVAALCDPSERVLRAVGDRWQVAARYRSHQDLLAREELDAVLVSNYDPDHTEVVLAAIAAGRHVLVEKPMCMTMREAGAVQTAQEQRGVVVQVGYMRRYAPAFVDACRLVAELGPVRLARVHSVLGGGPVFTQGAARAVRRDDLPAAALADGARRRDALVAEALGGAAPPDIARAYRLLLSLSSHDLSAMRELLGPPARVLYAAQRQGGLYLSAAFDYGAYVCQFETGVDAIARFDAHLEVYGERRVLRVQYDTPYVRSLPVRLHLTEDNGRGGVVERAEHPTWGDPFVAEWQAFYTNITERRPPKTSPADFRQDLALIGEMVALMCA
jgi:predicted dehydrogenase